MCPPPITKTTIAQIAHRESTAKETKIILRHESDLSLQRIWNNTKEMPIKRKSPQIMK
jgi:hypothetical protein